MKYEELRGVRRRREERNIKRISTYGKAIVALGMMMMAFIHDVCVCVCV